MPPKFGCIITLSRQFLFETLPLHFLDHRYDSEEQHESIIEPCNSLTSMLYSFKDLGATELVCRLQSCPCSIRRGHRSIARSPVEALQGPFQPHNDLTVANSRATASLVTCLTTEAPSQLLCQFQGGASASLNTCLSSVFCRDLVGAFDAVAI